MKILGISGYYHDAAAALLINDEIIAAAEEERFTRIKHDSSFPANAIQYCLDEGGIGLNDLDAIVFYDKPFLKFERLLETYHRLAPSGIISFLKSMPSWLKEKLFFRKLLKNELLMIDPDFIYKKANILFTEHHLSHAASAFYPSPFEEAAILTIDGVGEWATASIGVGSGNSIKILKELHYPDSVGLLYSSFTYFLGFKVNSGEYKLMGLAPYGNKDAVQTKKFIKIIQSELVNIYENGSIRLHKKYFNYSGGLTMIHTELWESIFNMPIRKAADKITQDHCNLALAIQQVTENIVILMARHAKQITGSSHLCMAGGVALNCVANGLLQKMQIVDKIFIQPASGDSGGALGAALAGNYIYFNRERNIDHSSKDAMKNAYLGPSFSNSDIDRLLKKHQAVGRKYPSVEEINKIVAGYLQEGKVIGYVSGRMEFGPRALGNRSILASPLIADMQKTINLKIKFREGFRPFAAILAENEVAEYFDYNTVSPYMLLVHHINKAYCKELPENYQDLSMEEKLNTIKSVFPAITHVDMSCRIQSLHPSDHPELWSLLQAFKDLTGYAMLINTSFNIRGEPIVCTPEEAYAGMMRTNMDALVMNNYLFLRAEQPKWIETTNIANLYNQD